MNVSSDPKSLGTGNLYLIALPGNLLRQELPQGTRFSLRTLTVIQISKFYETRLILDPGLFDLAAELEIDILPEPDGLGVFAAEGDPDVDQKAQALAARIGNNGSSLLSVGSNRSQDGRWLECFLPRTGFITRADSNCSGGGEKH